MYLIFSIMSKENQSPVQTKNEQTINFEKTFKEIYIKQPIEVILNHFLQCHLDLSESLIALYKREEQLEKLTRKEVYNA